MFRNFFELEQFILDKKICKRVVVAGGHDTESLTAIKLAKEKGLVTATLVGPKDKMLAALEEIGESASDYTLVDCADEAECARIAVAMVHAGEADFPMKGLLQTSDFMRAILDKKTGLLPEGNILSVVVIVEYVKENRLMFITDCAINIAPDYEAKVKITKNAVNLARRFGIECPKVAVVTPLEIVNPKIQSTVDAKMLADANKAGIIKNCIVEGPFALDNALSEKAAHHKGITGSQVAGKADIIVVPDLNSGNILTKAITHFSDLYSCGTLNGTSVPIIAASRTDTPQNKYTAILETILISL